MDRQGSATITRTIPQNTKLASMATPPNAVVAIHCSEQPHCSYKAPHCHRYAEQYLTEQYSMTWFTDGKKPSTRVEVTTDQKPLSDCTKTQAVRSTISESTQ